MILIGFMGAGKTTVGNALSDALGQPFYDLDKEITKKINMPIANFFKLHSEAQFRQLEVEYLSSYHQCQGVISTGGGCVETEENRTLLRNVGNVIYLKADFDVLRERIINDTINLRPVAQNKSFEDLHNLYLSRLSYYQSCATHVIETDNLSTQEVVNKILQLNMVV